MSYPIKISLDADLNEYLQGSARDNQLPVGTLVNNWLIYTHRNIGFETLLNLNSDFPLFLNPPQNAQYKLALRIKDDSILEAIAMLSDQHGRSIFVIYYSVLKALASQEIQRRHSITDRSILRSA